MPSLSSKVQVQAVANRVREGTQRKGRSSQETIAQPWARVLVLPQGINITPLSSSAELNLPNVPVQFSSVIQSCPTLCDPKIVARQPYLSITISRGSLKLMSIELWCHPAISSSVVPFSSCPQSLPASASFQWVNCSYEVAKVLEFQL